MTPIIMPQIGQDLETGVISRWAKKVGDPVKKGEALATVEGDKAAFDIESPVEGVLLQILVPEGQEGKVLQPIGYVGIQGEKTAESSPAPRPTAASSSAGAAPAAPAPASAASSSPSLPLPGRVFSSPAARRVAKELGLDVSRIPGTGPRGRVMKADVFRARDGGGAVPAASAPAAQGPAALPAALPAASREDAVIPHSRMRQIIADRLALSKSTIPHFYLFQDVDMEDALVWRELFNRQNGTRVTVTDMIVHVLAQVLCRFPRMNAHVEKDRIVTRGKINIGVATATDDGLLVPVIPDADARDIRALSAEIKARAEDARKGRIDAGVKGTFTVTSLGMFGTQSFLPIINPPEAAILGVGAAEPRPAAVGGMIGVRRIMTLTLSCDHRAVNGAEAATFLQALREGLRERFLPAR